MRMKALIIALALLPMPLAAEPLQPTKDDIKDAASSDPYAPYPEGEMAALQRDVRGALKRGSTDAAVDVATTKYGFPAAPSRRLVRAWVIAQARHYVPDKSWIAGTRAELLDVVPAFRGKPLALAFIGEALDATGDDCRADDFAALMQGSPDPAGDAYAIAAAATCTGNFARAAVAAGDRAMPALIRSAEYGGLPPRDTIPLYVWLTRPSTLAHVREADRPVVAAMLWQRYLKELFKADLTATALAAFDDLPADLRAAIVSTAPTPTRTVVIDGISMTFEADGNRSRSDLEAPILQLSEAMALAGRTDEARRLLATLRGLAEAKTALTCAYAATAKGSRCADTSKLPMGALPLDHLLNAPSEDPYPIAEITLSGSSNLGMSASDAILCRVFPVVEYPDVCRPSSDDTYLTESSTSPEELATIEAMIEKLIPDFKSIRTAALGTRDVPATTTPSSSRYARKTVIAVPPDFAEKPIPPQYLGGDATGDVKGLAPLPGGFMLVRAERAGQRVVAISVSQTYDPTGEVSQGGYWVHVSEDGGKHWNRPLYTGLADRFPYVVSTTSRMPLIDGDVLHVAVDIAEINTASITYPPVGLRSRRTAKDRYLAIPLELLRRDSDGDGLSDIAAHHLLLDLPKANGSRPFVVGSDGDADCSVAPALDKLALIGLLARMGGGSGAAVVEPVDRPAGEFATGWTRTAAAEDQPLFLKGDRKDYSCLRSHQLMIVYGQQDIEAIQAFTPDFHALEIPRIVFNRAHDRGFVRWSTGWSGGTYRLRFVNGKWQFDSISSWIS